MNSPTHSGGEEPAANHTSDMSRTRNGDRHLGPESDLQTAGWGDLVNDFWEEDDFDEPPSKVAKVVITALACNNLF